jgi:RND family efflux transporter MFP subunit
MRKLIASRHYPKIASGLGLFLLGAGWLISGLFRPPLPASDIPLVKTEVVDPSGNQDSYSYSGEVRGRYESQLAFLVGGKVVRRNVDLGSIVRAGELLLAIDPDDVQQNVSSAKAQLFAAQSQYKLAQDNLERFRELYDQKLMSQAEFDRYQSAYDSADAMLRQAKSQFNRGINQLNYCNLLADSNGVIAALNVETGQVVAAGQPVVVLVKGGAREIEVNFPENRLAGLGQAPDFAVTFWALPGVTLSGKLREVAPMADPVTRTYKARITLINPPADLKLGMTATATAASPSNRAGYLIPLSAIYQSGDSPGVWVIKQDCAKWKPVQLGSFGDEDRIQVVAGLHSGDVIVTAGVHKLREGQKVRTGDERQ